eukprot:m.17328 g.17328  ORF g.17328 m.17328 type:complete len:173 (-) comp7112_c0_seq1:144-662(-)
MDKEKLSKLQAEVRIGGKGTPRRKKKVINKSGQTDEKKLQGTLKKFGANPISSVEEVNMFRPDGKVLNFPNPKVQVAPSYNTFVVSGSHSEKDLAEMLPGILSQLGPESLQQLQKLAQAIPGAFGGSPAGAASAAAAADDDEVPSLVGNFEDASKKKGAEAGSAAATDAAGK